MKVALGYFGSVKGVLPSVTIAAMGLQF
jgi:hypothetical protein